MNSRSSFAGVRFGNSLTFVALSLATCMAVSATYAELPAPRPVEPQTSVTESFVTEPELTEPSTTKSAAPSTPEDAKQFTAEALEAQLVGNADEREELLQQAIDAAPNFAPARWQRGELFVDGKWQSLANVQDRLASNPHREEYLQLRASSPDTPAGHTELARWCRQNGLANEERYHWTRVLFADPRNELAQSSLGVKPYQGGLYTAQEIVDFETKQAEAESNLAKYQPMFGELCRTVTTTSDRAARQSALETLGRVNELAKLPALVAAIEQEAAQATPDDAIDLYLALVDSLSYVPHRQSTSTLLNISLNAEVPQIRHAAALALKSRPVTDYVPQLMASMAMPVHGQVESFALPDGTVSYGEVLYQEGPLADRTINRVRTALPVPGGGGIGNQRGNEAQLIRARGQASRAAEQTRQRIAFSNAQTAAGNARVREVISTALNFDLGDNPKNYWEEWKQYNELEFDEHPLYGFNDRQIEYVPTTHSCFMAGTPVWTQEGLRPIETIVVGDMVLAQHPETGEIAFRPVLEKTLGPPTQTVAIGLPEETIVATLGHRFWAERRGWEMAKALQPGMYLHAIKTSLPVESLEAGQQLRCHNMVVEGFHTYFVGESQILVHDKTCPQPTTSKTPGQATLQESLAVSRPSSALSR